MAPHLAGVGVDGGRRRRPCRWRRRGQRWVGKRHQGAGGQRLAADDGADCAPNGQVARAELRAQLLLLLLLMMMHDTNTGPARSLGPCIHALSTGQDDYKRQTGTAHRQSSRHVGGLCPLAMTVAVAVTRPARCVCSTALPPPPGHSAPAPEHGCTHWPKTPLHAAHVPGLATWQERELSEVVRSHQDLATPPYVHDSEHGQNAFVDCAQASQGM
jgi:hypothetical protein